MSGGFYLTSFTLRLVFLLIETDQSNELCIHSATWDSQRVPASIINVYCNALLQEVQMYHFNFRKLTLSASGNVAANEILIEPRPRTARLRTKFDCWFYSSSRREAERRKLKWKLECCK